MTRAVVFLLVCSTISVAGNPARVPDRERDGFIGPVKRVSEEWTPVGQPIDGIEPGTRCLSETRVYDRQGRLVQRSVYPGTCASGEIRDTYAYDAEGNQITNQEWSDVGLLADSPQGGAAPVSKITDRPKTVFKYDDQGRRIEETYTNPDGSVLSGSIFRYDTNGRLIEKVGYDEKRNPIGRESFQYRGADRFPSESRSYYGYGDEEERTAYGEYVTNSTGDWIKRLETREDSEHRGQKSLTLRQIEYFAP